MKSKFLLVLMALLPMATLITVTSCGDDDEIVQPPVNNNSNNGSNTDDNGSGDNNGDNSGNENTGQEVPEIVVVVNEDGTTSNGSIFSAIDDKNFYVDYIKYTVEEGHLAVSGYDKAGFKGVANIISKLTYKGNTYEVLTIGEDAFKRCTVMTSVTIPNNVTSIGSNAFYGCSSLTSIAIPNNVTSIGDYAFSGCSGLTSVTIPGSVTSIGGFAFFGCSSLTSINISDLASWCNISFSGFQSNPLRMARHLYVNGKEITDLVIPEGVIRIRNYAFLCCTSLTSVTVPNGVTSIGDSAFEDCSSLTSVIVKATTPPTIGYYTFSYHINVTLYVPVGCKAAYQAAQYWKDFKAIIEIEM